jgi:hypothetical protein
MASRSPQSQSSSSCSQTTLMAAPGLARVLDDLKVALA